MESPYSEGVRCGQGGLRCETSGAQMCLLGVYSPPSIIFSSLRISCSALDVSMEDSAPPS